MREVQGDLFEYADADAIVIPTNTQTKWIRGGLVEVAVMGGGVARGAADRYASLPAHLAGRMRRDGPEHVYVFDTLSGTQQVACLPTKRDWRAPADRGLISDMLTELVAITKAIGWESVALPRLGCGLGNLSWDEVGVMLRARLDDRFVVVHR